MSAICKFARPSQACISANMTVHYMAQLAYNTDNKGNKLVTVFALLFLDKFLMPDKTHTLRYPRLRLADTKNQPHATGQKPRHPRLTAGSLNPFIAGPLKVIAQKILTGHILSIMVQDKFVTLKHFFVISGRDKSGNADRLAPKSTSPLLQPFCKPTFLLK